MIQLPPLIPTLTPTTRPSLNGAFFFSLKRYEVLMLGHPDVFDDESSVSRFDEFDTLVLAGVDALSDTHVALLTAYVQRGGRLVLIGSESAATRDEELRVRPAGPALASLALHPDLQGNGSVFEVSNSTMDLFVASADPDIARHIARGLARDDTSRGFAVMNAPPSHTLRTNVFRHGGPSGPMASVTLSNWGDDEVQGGVELEIDATFAPCLFSSHTEVARQSAVQGSAAAAAAAQQSCVVWYHNLPLDGEGEAPVRLNFTINVSGGPRPGGTGDTGGMGGKLSILVKLPPIGSLAVLSIGAPQEEEVRRAAARLRKAMERLRIAARARGAGPAWPEPPVEADAEKLLLMVQCRAALDRCSGFSEMSPSFHAEYITESTRMAAAFEARVAAISARVATAQTSSNLEVLTLAQGAVWAFDFGLQAGQAGGQRRKREGRGGNDEQHRGRSAKQDWVKVTPETTFEPGSSFGWSSDVALISAANSSGSLGTRPLPSSVLGAPFADYLWGGVGDAMFSVGGLDPGRTYIVTVVVGLWDEWIKTAVTGVRDGRTNDVDAEYDDENNNNDDNDDNAAADDDDEDDDDHHRDNAAYGTQSKRKMPSIALNTGMPGDRVHSGHFEARNMTYTVGRDGRMVLHFTGQAVGPQLSVETYHDTNEAFIDDPRGWLVNAVIIREAASTRSKAEEGQSRYHNSRGFGVNDRDNHAVRLVSSAISEWDVIGPFNDSNATGLYRAVSTTDAAGMQGQFATRGDTDTNHSHPGKVPGSIVAWRRWQSGAGGLPVPIATVIGDDAKGSAAILQVRVKLHSGLYTYCCRTFGLKRVESGVYVILFTTNCIT